MSDEKARTLQVGLGVVGLACVGAAWLELIPWWLGLAAGLGVCLAAAVVADAAGKGFRDYVYEERYVMPGLPSETMAFLQRHSAALESLGFRQIGDYRLLPASAKHARIFASPGGRCFACLYTQLGGYAETTRISYLAYCSVTADGTYLESASYGGKYSLDPGVPLRFQYLDGAVSTAEALQQHREFVERHAAEAQTEALEFGPDQFRQVLDYGHRLSRWEEYQAVTHAAPAPPDGDATEAGALVSAGAE